MERKPHSTTGNIVGAVVLLVVVLLGIYVGGYFVLGKYGLANDIVVREYNYDWQVFAYRPLVHLENKVTGKYVMAKGSTTIYTSSGDNFDHEGRW